MWHNKYGARIINPKGYTVAKKTQKTMTHSHRHRHDSQEHTHQHANKPNQESHDHEHKHRAIELDMTDLKLWKKDEVG